MNINMNTWATIQMTDIHTQFIPKDFVTHTVVIVTNSDGTHDYILKNPTETEDTIQYSRMTLAVIKQHSSNVCPGNCALHPLMTTLFREMTRGDIAWGTLCE